MQILQLPDNAGNGDELEFLLTGTRKPCKRNDLVRSTPTEETQSSATVTASATDWGKRKADSPLPAAAVVWATPDSTEQHRRQWQEVKTITAKTVSRMYLNLLFISVQR